ncbi:17893_t:CDS:2 [Funneliformis caledonium]|uniref:17893_t:CDS:1 n=1 Tax=Funneliformis caledonium TaxID=1117310 RepID=A0A9N9BUN4_9GLOM|nr:17893_t:CDS:2 [Funneliformis caledonium]
MNDIDRAIFYYVGCNPSFCYDLCMETLSEREESVYDVNYCKQDGYEKSIRKSEEVFSVEDYEEYSYDECICILAEETGLYIAKAEDGTSMSSYYSIKYFGIKLALLEKNILPKQIKK